MVYLEQQPDRRAAMLRERAIKSLKRKRKLELIGTKGNAA
jgi:predicted GIY-YIG superfamily endonuclease